MRNFFKYLLLSLVLPLFPGCSSDDDDAEPENEAAYYFRFKTDNNLTLAAFINAGLS
jgi:hypothetical protein